MKVTPVKTELVTPGYGPVTKLLDQNLETIKDGAVLAITSKVVAICEGRVVPLDDAEKTDLVIAESDLYLPEHYSKYGFTFTVTNGTLIPAAGIDESNAAGHYVLWPQNPQQSAALIWRHLKATYGVDKVGVVITDSTARPLHYGTEGVAIAYCGFKPTNNYIGTPDLFGRTLQVSIANVVDALASAAVLVMGEGREQTPLAIIDNLPFINFTDQAPSKDELAKFFVSPMEDDIFAPFLKNAKWQKGGRPYRDSDKAP